MQELTTVNNSVTVLRENLFDKWILFAQVKDSSAKAYSDGIKYLADYFAANHISRPTREDFLNWREFLKNNYSVATANLAITSAKLFLSFLHSEGYIPNNPAEHLKGLKQVKGHKKDALSGDDVKLFLKLSTLQTISASVTKQFSRSW